MKTCLLLAATLLPILPLTSGEGAPAAAPASPHGEIVAVDGTPQKGRLKIMPLGDSITFGSPDPGYGGYRHLLGTLLASDGYGVEFVGSRRSGDTFAGGPDNEGHPGWTIEQLKNGIDTGRWLEAHRPDVILLHIGTNDIRRGEASAAPGRLAALLDDILGRLPQARVIVAQIIPYRRGPEPGHLSYNAAIPNVVASKGARVSLVDLRAVLTRADYADGFHPNAGGYDKMAQAWAPAIRAALGESAQRSAAARPLPPSL